MYQQIPHCRRERPKFVRMLKTTKLGIKEKERIMRKLRKVMALLLTIAMVMGMSLTSFAANGPIAPTAGAVITIDDLPTGSTAQYIQIVKPNNKSTSGWQFVENNTIKQAFVDVYVSDGAKLSAENLETAIKGLMGDYEGKDNSNVTSGNSSSSSKLSSALLDISNLANQTITGNSFTTADSVDAAGLYMISVFNAKYTSIPMLVYVDYDPTTGVLTGTNVTPKMSDNTISKSGKDVNGATDNDENSVVAIGDTVEYEIRVRVPYVDPDKFGVEPKPEFIITDTIDGADYTNLENATITMGVGEQVPGAEIKVGANSHTFTVNLSSVLNPSNSNANKEIVITYQAIVTKVTVNNKAEGHVSDTKLTTGEKNFYTGEITLIKTGENKNEFLSGAGFKVTKGTETTALKFTEGTPLPDGTKVYTYDSKNGAEEVFTGTNGKLKVEGLDVGTYYFTETTAPDGYSLNDEKAEAELTTSGETATEIIKDTTEMNDTTLASLPSTGGIGTTIFTIGGCVIMIAAAGLYFASRRKHGEN